MVTAAQQAVVAWLELMTQLELLIIQLVLLMMQLGEVVC
jgi:hypothetical protein